MTEKKEKSNVELFFTWLWLAFLLSSCLIAYPPIVTAISDRQQCDTLYEKAAQQEETKNAEQHFFQQGELYRDCCNLLAKPKSNVCSSPPTLSFNPMEWPTILYYQLIKLKATTLVLIMVTISGMMGSTIHLCRRFFGLHEATERVYTLRWYLLRPFSGAITAVALFVLIMSGQMAFTQSTEESLSPYLISFIALIGGFLSIQAQDRIKQAGQNFLKGKSVETSHFTTPLFRKKLSEMEQNGITAERLCAHQDFSVGQIEAWKEGHLAVAEKYQPILAAWMDESIEALFDRKQQDKK